MLKHLLELNIHEVNQVLTRSRLELLPQYYSPGMCIICKEIGMTHRVKTYWEGKEFSTYCICKSRGKNCIINFLFMWVLLGDA